MIYSTEDRIKLHKIQVDLLELLFPDKDYQYLAQEGEIACSHIAIIFIRNNDLENAWKWLEKSADFAINMDTYDFDATHTSPILRGYSDGGWIMDATYHFLRNAELSTLIMDATCGDDIKDDRMAGHNSLPMIRLLLHALRHSRMVVPETNIVLTHLAPSLHRPHAETVQIVEKDGFVVAYDGLTIDI